MNIKDLRDLGFGKIEEFIVKLASKITLPQQVQLAVLHWKYGQYLPPRRAVNTKYTVRCSREGGGEGMLNRCCSLVAM